MRRFLFGLVIASMTAAAPISALGGDREIADAIVSTLKQKQANGSLKGFNIDLSVDAGKVTLTGKVTNDAQLKSVMTAAKSVAGVKEIVNQITVTNSAPIAPASNFALPVDVKPIDEPMEVKPAAFDFGSSAVEEVADIAPPRLMPEPQSSSEDTAIKDEVLSQLGHHKNSGALRQFELDVSCVNREVWVRGYVANAQQKQTVLKTVQHVAGVKKVIDEVTIGGGNVMPAASTQGSSMPVAGGGMPPRAFAPSMLASQCGPDGGYASGGQPMPMQGGPSYGGGVPRYDQPYMPNYAWPSYASYPNYAAVTYPKQYSASAWPYIGPFYPYPQVPLGWRKVALEWDDGLWYLDFTSK